MFALRGGGGICLKTKKKNNVNRHGRGNYTFSADCHPAGGRYTWKLLPTKKEQHPSFECVRHMLGLRDHKDSKSEQTALQGKGESNLEGEDS